MGTSGWLVLLEELPLRQGVGVVRVVAPLVSCNVCAPNFLSDVYD